MVNSCAKKSRHTSEGREGASLPDPRYVSLLSASLRAANSGTVDQTDFLESEVEEEQVQQFRQKHLTRRYTKTPIVPARCDRPFVGYMMLGVEINRPRTHMWYGAWRCCNCNTSNTEIDTICWYCKVHNRCERCEKTGA